MDAERTQRLTEVFRAVFNQHDLELREDLTAADVAGWDSMNHVNLIIQIEQAFEIRFSNEEVNSFAKVGDLIACIDQKLA